MTGPVDALVGWIYLAGLLVMFLGSTALPGTFEGREPQVPDALWALLMAVFWPVFLVGVVAWGVSALPVFAWLRMARAIYTWRNR